ncbi:MAG: OmpA family protein [Mycobacteriales bacterium]
MSVRWRALLLAAGLLTAGWLVPTAALGQDQPPSVIDPLADNGERPTRSDLVGSIRVLKPSVRRLEVSVRELKSEQRRDDRVTVTISSDVLFAFNSAELSPVATRAVEDLASRIARTPAGGAVLVVGHTDAIGTLAYNQDLSERRAVAVADVLRDRVGGGRSVNAEGRNFSEPVASETSGGQDDPKGRALNRRVTISFAEPA